jgi:septum formation protein
MLRRLQGKTHEVLTGVCLLSGGSLHTAVARTAVTFLSMGEDDIQWYVATGEPMGKAGAYHIEGRGALFIERVSGSPSNVAGLPAHVVLALAREAGLDLEGSRG